MKSMLVAAGLAVAVPVAAHAQAAVAPRPLVEVQYHEPDDYWRHHEGEREAEWRRREEFRAEAERRDEWRHRHCVRDWQGQEFCRR